MTFPASGKAACEISATGLGMVTGAIGGLGNPLFILAGSAAGYLLGKIVCKFPPILQFFEEKVEVKDWDKLGRLMGEPAVRDHAIAQISNEVGVDDTRAGEIWDAILFTLKADPQSIVGTTEFEKAHYHPATGHAKHGITALSNTKSAISKPIA